MKWQDVSGKGRNENAMQWLREDKRWSERKWKVGLGELERRNSALKVERKKCARGEK